MLNKLSYLIYDFLNEDNRIAEDKELFIHSITLMIHEIINTLVLIALSLVFNNCISTILYIVFFALLRRYTGGYHATTFQSCSLWYFLLYLGFQLTLFLNIFETSWFSFLVLLIVVSIIYSIAPMQHVNQPLSIIERHRYRSKMLFVLIIYSILSIYSIIVNGQLKNILLYILVIDTFLLVALRKSKFYKEDYNEN